MTVKEMLAAGMSREAVAARLVRGRVAPDMANAYFMIALTLGETDGDVLNAELGENEDAVRLMAKAIGERRQAQVGSVSASRKE